MAENPNAPIKSFDVERASRYIALGKPLNETLPLFDPLLRTIIRQKVSFDPRNHQEDDLMQVGRMKAVEVIHRFDPNQGNLFVYASKLISQVMWATVKLRPIDKMRASDDVDPDNAPDNDGCAHNLAISSDFEQPADTGMPQAVMSKLRLEQPEYADAVEYIYGVLLDNDYEQNKARILKTLTHGFDVNPKNARFLLDHVFVALRSHYSAGPKEVRDDAFFDNKFKYTLVPELRELLGEKAFEKLIHFFGGITISVPSVDHIASIERDLTILAALARDWSCGPSLAKKFGISPEGTKAIYKTCLVRLQMDAEFRKLVSHRVKLDTLPGYEDPTAKKPKKTMAPNFGEKRSAPRRNVQSTDSMGFALGSRNSLLFTMIAMGQSTRSQLVDAIVEKFKSTPSAAKGTVGVFLSDIRRPHGTFNTSRNLRIVCDAQQRLAFTPESLEAARQVVRGKKQAAMLRDLDQNTPGGTGE